MSSDALPWASDALWNKSEQPLFPRICQRPKAQHKANCARDDDDNIEVYLHNSTLDLMTSRGEME